MKKSIFFYGALCHLPLLEIILGRQLNPGEVEPASLDNCTINLISDTDISVIKEQVGATADGIVFRPTKQDRARLEFFAMGSGFHLAEVVTDRPIPLVETFVPIAHNTDSGQEWSQSDFVRKRASRVLQATRDLMSFFGVIDGDEIERRQPWIQTMSAARSRRFTNTRTKRNVEFGSSDVSIVKYQRIYDGFYAMDEFDLRHRRFDSSQTEPLNRLALVVGDASIVLPYDPIRDRVLLVEQFRVGPFARGDQFIWQMEPIAGRVDPDESPEQAARREAQEEAGINLTDLIPISSHYPSPGASTEFFHCFLGITDLPDNSQGHGGLNEEGEDIRTHLFGFDELLDFVESPAGSVGPLVLCALWLARHRDRLRTAA